MLGASIALSLSAMSLGDRKRKRTRNAETDIENGKRPLPVHILIQTRRASTVSSSEFS